MADSEVQGLTELTSPSGDDLVFAVDDPAGTPLARKVQVSNLIGYLVTTAGDILYATAARTLARLGIGTAGQVLAVNAGATAPAWANAAGADGWTPDTATWTYASASTFTVATNVTAQFRKGTKLKLTQTTAKYFYVVSSSYGAPNTTVTVTGGTDYTVANAAITLPYYSYAECPQGFPDWFNWIPAWTNLTVGNGTVTAQFRLTGGWVSLILKLVWGSTTSIDSSAGVGFSAPLSSSLSGAYIFSSGVVALRDEGTATYFGRLQLSTVTTFTTQVESVGGTYTTAANITASVPHTWTTTDVIGFQGDYPLA